MFALRRLRIPPSCGRAPCARALSTSFPRFNASSSNGSDGSTTSTPTETRRNDLPSLFSPEDSSKPFYVTTPIFYVNASPHIGHLHSVVLADVLARFSRLRNPSRPVVFSTGTDEHGLKIQQAAAKAGKSEHEFCDEVSMRFRNLSDRAFASYTDFIRTSEPRHYAAVDAFWAKLVESGAVYKGSHSGWYSVSDECFYTETQIEKGPNGTMIATESGSEVVWQEEENWKFRLSMFAGHLRKWLGNPESVYPAAHHASILTQTENMEDLSISRPASRVKWGVPVPGDPSQTIYVWVDALINYLTVAGYPDNHAAWPADMHIVGKDIIRFHALHWPALLAAAGEPMPKRVLSHAHWTMDRAKMSKSRGNVADPLAAMDKYGADGVRFYLMRTGGALDRDADYSEAELERAFARLQGQLGNLAQRITSPAILGKVGTWDGKTARDEVLDAALRDTRDAYEAKFERYDLTMASESLFTPLYEANRYFQVSEPWAAGAEAAPAIMYAYHSLRVVGILALPILPGKAAELLDRLGVPEEERTWANASWTPDMGGLDTQLIAQRLQQGAERFNRVPLFPSPEGAKPAKGAKSAKVPQQTKNRKDKADRKDKKNKKSTD